MTQFKLIKILIITGSTLLLAGLFMFAFAESRQHLILAGIMIAISTIIAIAGWVKLKIKI